jgi:hypothetical protein
MLNKSTIGVAAIAVLCGGVLKAHHNYAEYLPREHGITIEGTIKHIEFASPHILFKLRTADSTLYTLMWNGIPNVARYGVTSDTLKVGDHIIVTGSPARDPAVRSLGRLREIRRPSDGWCYRSGQRGGCLLSRAN